MGVYTSRTYNDRKTLQTLWETGIRAEEIANQMNIPLTTLYKELRRGQDGSRLPNQRLRYNADLAQLRMQQSFERRGKRAGKERAEHEQL